MCTKVRALVSFCFYKSRIPKYRQFVFAVKINPKLNVLLFYKWIIKISIIYLLTAYWLTPCPWAIRLTCPYSWANHLSVWVTCEGHVCSFQPSLCAIHCPKCWGRKGRATLNVSEIISLIKRCIGKYSIVVCAQFSSKLESII